MNPEQEQFRDLRRLLVLKRYEQPPLGFYDRFPREVLIRIRAGERCHDAATFEGLFAEPRWVQRILAAFETQPVVAGAFGLAMCGLLIAGVMYSESSDRAAVRFVPPAEPMPGTVWAPPAPSEDGFLRARPAASAQTVSAQADSTSGYLGQGSSLFEASRRYRQLKEEPRVLPLIFRPGN